MYSALQTGVLDAGITSASSFASYKLFEVVDYLTAPTNNTFWFMAEPLVISTKTWDTLSADQQAVMEEVAAELQTFVNEASTADDARVAKLFTDEGVDVYEIDDAAYAKWVEAAKPQWDAFAKDVEGGQELIDMALAVE